MTSEEWSRIEALFHDVLELPDSERAAFLSRVCGDDAKLRQQVESLIARAETNDVSFQREFLQAASVALSEQPRLGSTVGHYKLVSILGTGGTGIVYQARDTHLDRVIALKVLLPEFVADAERRRRFVLEAKSASALNHPNIITIYDINSAGGMDFIAMEYVEGSSLDHVIPPEGLPIQQVLNFAAQIASALTAAHEAGIVHRDIKTANIMVTRSGRIKVLDFGLAKLMEQFGSTLAATSSGATKAGAVMGTAAYMAPEQAEGKAVDERADIFSFGAVLYEMITGQRAFCGDSAVAVVAAVLKESPNPVENVRDDIPEGLARILSRCLEKQRDNRYVSARLLQDDLALLRTDPRSGNSDQRKRWRRAIAVPVIMLLIGLAGLTIALGLMRNRSSPGLKQTSLPEMRLQINTPSTSAPFDFALSPDGRYIAFVASGEGPQRLWLRALDAVDAQPLVGTDGARLPFWSPDSRSIGFFASSKLFRIDVDRVAAPQFIANAPVGNGGTWNADGTILYAPSDGGRLFRVRQSGGDPIAVTQLDSGQTAHCCPHFLSDGSHFLFGASASRIAAPGIYLGSLDGSRPKQLTSVQSNPRSAQFMNGDMVIIRLGPLVARRLDLVRGELTGDPILVADSTPGNLGGFSVSSAGLLAYRAAQTQLTWFDRAGKVMGVVGEAGTLGYPELSPDQRRVAIDQQENGHDGWLIDLARGVNSPFTFGKSKGVANYPFVWSPDGKWIAFCSDSVSSEGVYRKPTTGTGIEELLLQNRNTKTVQDWSSDGRFLLYYEVNPQTARDLWVLDMSGKDRQAHPVVNTVFDERNGQFSPDGRWLAYETDESGRVEIVVQPFPEPIGKWQVSMGGGAQPRWRADGKELYFIAPDKSLMAVAITGRGSTFEAGTPVRLFSTHIKDASLPFKAQYAVSHDGRFLINETVEKSTTPITLILNWKLPSSR